MATEIASFYATISAETSGLQRGLGDTKSALEGLKTGFGQLQDIATTSLKIIGTAIIAAGTAVATTGIQFDAMKEQANVAFTTMLGSGKSAQKMLDDLQAFAQKTPFEFPDLIRASQRLMAMGIQAQQVIPTLTAIGDAVAAMGGSAEMVDRVTTAIGQMNAKGKVSAEEMRQLTEAGIPAWQMLADKIGVSIPEAMDAVTHSTVTAATGIQAITEGIETRFGGMMDQQSKTFNGIISNIKDGFTQLSGTIMQPFFDMAKGGLEKVQNALQDMQKTLQEGGTLAEAFGAAMADILPPEMLDSWNAFITYAERAYEVVRQLFAPVAAIITKFVGWQDVLMALGIVVGSVLVSIVAGFAPVIATFAVITAAVAALRYAWQNDFGGIRSFTQGVMDKITGFFHEHFGAWADSWSAFSDHLNFIVFYMWSNYVYFPIRSRLIMIRNDIQFYLMIAEKIWKDWSTNVMRIIGEWVSNAQAKFWEWVGIVSNWYHEWADPIWDKLGEWANMALKWYHGWADPLYTNYLKPWIDKVIKLFQPLIDWWGDHVQPMVDKGKAWIQGLWDGVKEKWNAFNSWWQGIWTGSVQWVKDLLGISSPSTVFADIGDNMIAGLNNGLMARIPELNMTMGAVMDGALEMAHIAIPNWEDVGKSIPDNIAKGISDNTLPVINAVKSLSDDIVTTTAGFGPAIHNYWLDLLNAKIAAQQLASLPTLPPAPVLSLPQTGFGPAAGTPSHSSSGSAVSPAYSTFFNKTLSSAAFGLLGANNSVVKQISDFANAAFTGITSKGQLQGSSAAYLGYEELSTNAGGDQVGRVINAVLALVAELQSRGVTGVDTKGIDKLISFLQSQGANGLNSSVNFAAGLR